MFKQVDIGREDRIHAYLGTNYLSAEDVRRDQATSLRPQQRIRPCRTRRCALPKCVLLIALAIVPIGCNEKVHNKNREIYTCIYDDLDFGYCPLSA